MGRAVLVGVMGPGRGAGEEDLVTARQLGRAIATRGWVTLCGGRNSGVMSAVSEAAKQARGLTLGFLPGEDLRDTAEGVLVALPTGLGQARNNLNVLSADLVVAIAYRPGSGTFSEICLADKNAKPLLVITRDPQLRDTIHQLCRHQVVFAAEAEEAIHQMNRMVRQNRTPEDMELLRLERG